MISVESMVSALMLAYSSIRTAVLGLNGSMVFSKISMTGGIVVVVALVRTTVKWFYLFGSRGCRILMRQVTILVKRRVRRRVSAGVRTISRALWKAVRAF